MTTQIGEIIQVRTAEQIRDAILDELAALLGISDQNLGSWIRTKCYAFGVELAGFYYQLWRGTRSFYIRKATGAALGYRAQDFSLIREPAIPAIGYQTFVGTPGTSIPVGSQVARPASAINDQLLFETTLSAVIDSGGVVEVPIRATLSGDEGNLAPNTITELVSSINGITNTYNATLTRLGQKEEDDESLRARILRTIAGLSRGTVPSIRNGTLDFRIQSMTLSGSIDDTDVEIPVDEDLNLVPIATSGTVWVGPESVTYTGLDLSNRPHKLIGVTRGQNGTSAQVHQDTTNVREYVPAGRGERVTSALVSESPGQVTVVIDDSTPEGAASELVGLVQSRLNGDATDRNPGYRGGGILLSVYPASIGFVGVNLTLAIEQGYIASQVQKAAQERLIRSVNSLGINEPMYAYELACVAQDTPGVETVKELTILEYDLSGTTITSTLPFVGDNTADLSPPVLGVLRTDTTRVSVGV